MNTNETEVGQTFLKKDREVAALIDNFEGFKVVQEKCENASIEFRAMTNKSTRKMRE